MGAHRIMLVDDDRDVRESLSLVLRDEGHEVALADGWRELLRQLHRMRCAGALPEVILLDLMLPEFTGFELLETLRRNPKYREIPVIVITAKCSGTVERICPEVCVCEKPLDLGRLEEQIEDVIAQAQQARCRS